MNTYTQCAVDKVDPTHTADDFLKNCTNEWADGDDRRGKGTVTTYTSFMGAGEPKGSWKYVLDCEQQLHPALSQ